MCTFLIFLLVSKLADGLSMGNKTSGMRTDVPTDRGSPKNLQPVTSEEDYLPMPRSMRKSLLNGRKFKRVLPSRFNPDINTSEKENILLINTVGFNTNIHSLVENIGGNYESYNISTDTSNELEEKHEASSDVLESSNYIMTPVVTVVSPIEVSEKSKSLPNTRVDEEREIAIHAQDSSPRKTHVTNRKYSLMDMRTGLGKSRFTLDLEDRLRKSKGELGFDDHLKGWKEFSYKVEKSKEDGRKNLSLEKGIQAKVNESFGTVDYYTPNCQILGLCSIGKPQAFPNKTNFEPTLLRDEFGTGDKLNNLIRTHSKKEGCPCDLCTLAFLTDMNCHGGKTSSVKHRSKSNLSNTDRTNRMMKEHIRIIDNKNGKKSIEISVRSFSPDTGSSMFSNCSNMSVESQGDCTNSRIRKMFKRNNIKEVKEIYTNPNSTYNDLSIEKLPLTSIECFEPPSWAKRTVKKTTISRSSSPYKTKYRNISSTTMTGSFASSSSLSTILSYRRVRRIFQSIIEGNRTRKRTKFEINKFKEMEELGLGRFKNNCWYPCECKKTLSIWRNMNESVQGLQGEFIKHQKATNKL